MRSHGLAWFTVCELARAQRLRRRHTWSSHLVVVQHRADFVAERADLVLVQDHLPRQPSQRLRPRVAIDRGRRRGAGAVWLRRGDADLRRARSQCLE